jgi:hypothetical protein
MSNFYWSLVGWVGTVIFVASFLVNDRALLHALGLVGCLVKLSYTYHIKAWPLVVNWVLLIVIEAIKWFRYRKDHDKPLIEQFFKCQW